MTDSQQIIKYVNDQLLRGVGKENIRSILTSGGWKKDDIDQALIKGEELIKHKKAEDKNKPSLADKKEEKFGNLDKKTLEENPNGDNEIEIFENEQEADGALPSISNLISHSLNVYQNRLTVYLGIMALQLTFILALIFFGGSLETTNLKAFHDTLRNASNAKEAGLVILFFTVTYLIKIWGYAALIFAAVNDHEDASIGESYLKSFNTILSYYWIFVLMAFILFGGFCFLVIPALIFLVWFSQAIFIPIDQGLVGMNALAKSKKYVEGHWGGVFFRLLAIAFIALAIYVPTLFIEIKIVRILAEAVLAPFVIIYLFSLYENLKIEKNFPDDFTPSFGSKSFFVLVGFLGILIIVGGVIFAVLSYSNKGMVERRQDDILAIENALHKYRKKHGKFPKSLDVLTPDFIESIPNDPFLKKPYPYRIDNGGNDYEICIEDLLGYQVCIMTPIPGEKERNFTRR